MAKHGENIYKRKDGRYEGRYVIGRTAEGRTRFGYVYGKQYGEVRRALAQRRASLLQSTMPRQGSLALWMNRYLHAEVRPRVKPSSYQTYASQAARHILPHLGHLELTFLSTERLRAFLDDLTCIGLSAGMVRSVWRLLAACLDWAVAEGALRRNPCVKLPLPPKQPSVRRVLTQAEQLRLACAAQEKADLAVLLGLYTGMRLGEICALRWGDIDWAQETATVCRTAQRIAQPGGGTALVISPPKSAHSCRVLPLSGFLMALLARHRHGAPDQAFLCTGELHPLEPRTAQRRFASLAAALGLTGVHFHTLRHSFATRLIELQVDVKTVSVLLGHASTRITMDCYVHSLMDSQRQAMVRLASSLPPSSRQEPSFPA